MWQQGFRKIPIPKPKKLVNFVSCTHFKPSPILKKAESITRGSTTLQQSSKANSNHHFFTRYSRFLFITGINVILQASIQVAARRHLEKEESRRRHLPLPRKP